MNKAMIALLLAAPLGACQTASFAPPGVNPQLKASHAGASGCGPVTLGDTIGRDVDGAMTLTDNFIFAYRCGERQLANGRQYFQVPSFIAAVGGLIGPTLGMSNNAVLLTGASAGVFNTGNSYYAPQAKAGIVSSALRALTCIKVEAAGISYFNTDEPEKPKPGETPPPTGEEMRQILRVLQTQQAELTQEVARGDAAAGPALAINLAQQRRIATVLAEAMTNRFEEAASGEVEIDAEAQYFEMVSGALFSVESILGKRLRDTGSLDTADVFAKLTELAKAHEEAQAALDAARNEQEAAETGGNNMMGFLEQKRKKTVKLENAALQPKLQTCVLQAWS